jgi:hypothetical protein
MHIEMCEDILWVCCLQCLGRGWMVEWTEMDDSKRALLYWRPNIST